MARRTVQNYIAELPTEPETSLALSAIILPKSQPRRYFDANKIQQLADSIREHGILEPLLVRPIPKKSNIYELVAGERRYRAASSLNLATVPVVIRELDDQQALTFALVENLVREDLNPVEEAEGILTLLGVELGLERSEVTSLLYRLENEQKGKTTRNVMGSEVSQQIQSLFESLGQNWLSFISNRLPLLNLPEDVLNALRTGKLAYTKAKAIAKIKDEIARGKLLEDAIAQNLSLSQIRERVRALQSYNEDIIITPKMRVESTAKRINALKLWESDPKKWKQLESLLQKIERLLASESS